MKNYPQCFISTISRYSFTRPIKKDGTFAEFFQILLDIAEQDIPYMTARNSGKFMTYQSLRETGLIQKTNKNLEITKKGLAYIQWHIANHEQTPTPDVSNIC